jgi:hypothetical protein
VKRKQNLGRNWRSCSDRTIGDLFPFYLNDDETLSDAQRARVRSHLQQCETCRQEVRALMLFRQRLQAATTKH